MCSAVCILLALPGVLAVDLQDEFEMDGDARLREQSGHNIPWERTLLLLLLLLLHFVSPDGVQVLIGTVPPTPHSDIYKYILRALPTAAGPWCVTTCRLIDFANP